jgi:hypothetical protein
MELKAVMIDPPSRRRLAEDLRHLAIGRISTGAYRLDRKTRRDVARCILFLRSMRPYEWPAPSRWYDLVWLPVHLATLGLSSRLQRNRWRSSGEFSVWPFRRWTDYRAALRLPVYLQGLRL